MFSLFFFSPPVLLFSLSFSVFSFSCLLLPLFSFLFRASPLLFPLECFVSGAMSVEDGALELLLKKKSRACPLFFSPIHSSPSGFLCSPPLCFFSPVFFFVFPPPVFGPFSGFYGQRMHVFSLIIKTCRTVISEVMVTVGDGRGVCFFFGFIAE